MHSIRVYELVHGVDVEFDIGYVIIDGDIRIVRIDDMEDLDSLSDADYDGWLQSVIRTIALRSKRMPKC